MIAGGGCDANLRLLAHLWIIDYTQVLLIRDDKTAMQVAVQCQWFRYGAVKIHGKNLEILTAQSGTIGCYRNLVLCCLGSARDLQYLSYRCIVERFQPCSRLVAYLTLLDPIDATNSTYPSQSKPRQAVWAPVQNPQALST